MNFSWGILLRENKNRCYLFFYYKNIHSVSDDPAFTSIEISIVFYRIQQKKFAFEIKEEIISASFTNFSIFAVL
jgi:hypothetical protein